jgi:Trk K+ transport system NAD-binding subunit
MIENLTYGGVINSNVINNLIREISPDCIIFQGDATDDSMFDKVNPKNAKGLVATLSNDKDNLSMPFCKTI